MFSFLGTSGKQILMGNVLFIVCCGFYLAWWVLAFKPVGAITGLKTGWLLIPASIAGLWGVVQVLRGALVETPQQLLSGWVVLWGGIALYLVLLAVTVVLFKRQATTELFLIVGWAMLAVTEINALFGLGLTSRGLSIGLIVMIALAVAVSLVCYVLYYRLDDLAGYIDGMVPLILAALTMAATSCFMLVQGNA